jgi:5-(carboxyamino)imidazole ribonucleotide synthase
MILPPATLGLLGGGQLGRFFVMAAHELGYRVIVLDPDHDSPAGRIADEHLVAGYGDSAALGHIASVCAAVTTEFENVPAKTLAYLALSVRVRPGAEAVAVCQNRSTEKGFLKRYGFPHAPYTDIRSEDDVANADAGRFPAILKVARFGYDGKGQASVKDKTEALAAFRHFSYEPCVLEKRLPLDHEVSVVLARDETGRIKCFPAAENHHRHGILDVSSVPPARACHAGNAEHMAGEIARHMDYVGVLAVEFFVVHEHLYVNEMAPRPHNSGHYTLDGCISDQFEQQVRVLCNLPLGDARCHSAAAMVNLLGDLWYPEGADRTREPDWQKLLAVPNLKLHLYGKRHAKPGRKMGHFTVLGADPTETLNTAMAARAAIGMGND